MEILNINRFKIYYPDFGLIRKLCVAGFNDIDKGEEAFDMIKEEINEDIG